MIFPAISGVLFTKHPVSNDSSKVIIESSYGLGETVVSGNHVVDHFEIPKEKIAILESSTNSIIQDIGEKIDYISPNVDNLVRTDIDRVLNPSVSISQLKKISELAISILLLNIIIVFWVKFITHYPY